MWAWDIYTSRSPARAKARSRLILIGNLTEKGRIANSKVCRRAKAGMSTCIPGRLLAMVCEVGAYLSTKCRSMNATYGSIP